MIALLTIQKYACRSFSSSGWLSAGEPAVVLMGPLYRSATSHCRGRGAVPGVVGAREMRLNRSKAGMRGLDGLGWVDVIGLLAKQPAASVGESRRARPGTTNHSPRCKL